MSDPTTAAPLPAEGASPDAPAPVIRVLAGHPTDDELAAVHSVLVAVLAEQAALGAERVDPPIDLWRRSARGMRAAVAAGPGAWAASSGLRGC